MSFRNQFIPEMFAAQSGDRVMGWDNGVPTALTLGPGFTITGNQFQFAGGGGTVTSVGLSPGSTGLSVSGTNPIVGSGTFTLGGTLNAASGGTGINAYTVGDLLQANAPNSLQRLIAVATGNVLLSGGVGAVSFWGKVDLTAHISGTLPVANGGTGLNGSFSVGDIFYASGPFAISRRPVGSNGQVLTVVSGQPTWANITGTGTVTSVNVSGLGTGMTFTGGPITSSGSITMAGVLDVDNGGTGQTTYTVGDILQATGATTLSKLAAVATGNVLLSGGVATASSWGKVGLTTHVIGTLPIANGGTNITTYAAGDLLYASATNTLSKLAFATNGYVLTLVAGLPAWAAPTGGGGSGSVTSVALSAPSIFSVSGSPVTTSGTLGFALNTQNANLVFAGPTTGVAAVPAFRGLVVADLPNWVIEDIPTGSNYNFVSADNNKIKRFVDTTPRTLTIPTGLPTGWNCIVVRGPAPAAVPTIASLGTYEGAGTTLDTPNTWAQIVHRGSNIHMAAGAFTGLTNTAANTELAMSNGTDLVPSGVYAPTANNLRLGTSTTAGNRTITFDSVDASPTLSIQNNVASPSAGMVLGKGNSTLKLYSSVQICPTSALSSTVALITQFTSLGTTINTVGTDVLTHYSVASNGIGLLVRVVGGHVTATTGNSSTTGTVSISPGLNANASSPGNISSGNILIEMPAPFGTGIYGNLAIFNPTYNTAPNFQSGQKITYIGNAVVVPTGNPVGGGFLYVEAGALKYRGTSGTITTLGPA